MRAAADMALDIFDFDTPDTPLSQTPSSGGGSVLGVRSDAGSSTTNLESDVSATSGILTYGT